MLDVPYVSQGDDETACVPTCVKMIIEFYNRKYPDLPNPDIKTLKRVMDSEDDGTTLGGVVQANRILKGETHQLEFDWREYASFSDLENELDQDRPVIAWIKPNRLARISHSIVIKEINETDLVVKVNDPDSIETTEYDTTMFMSVWDNSDRVLIRARVSDRESQREMSDYT